MTLKTKMTLHTTPFAAGNQTQGTSNQLSTTAEGSDIKVTLWSLDA